MKKRTVEEEIQRLKTINKKLRRKIKTMDESNESCRKHIIGLGKITSYAFKKQKDDAKRALKKANALHFSEDL